MPALIQICIVIVTIGLLAIALMTVRTMTRINKATEELSQLTHAVRESIVKFDLVTHEARALVATLRECVPPVLRVVDRFEAVGQRTADLSSALLDGFELPVFTAVARGVRSGANHLLQRLMHRFTHRYSPLLTATHRSTEDMTMNDALHTRGPSNTGLTLMGFALGAAVGAGLALLMAPDSGKKTRERLASTARRWSKSAGHTIDQARDTVVELGTDAKSAIQAGLHDRATRESRSERRMSHADDLNAVKRSSEEAAR